MVDSAESVMMAVSESLPMYNQDLDTSCSLGDGFPQRIMPIPPYEPCAHTRRRDWETNLLISLCDPSLYFQKLFERPTTVGTVNIYFVLSSAGFEAVK